MDLVAWDEVAEISFTTRGGNARVTSAGLAYRDPGPLPVVTPHGPGAYRARVHARGRDRHYDGAAEQPYEDYLIVTWPAPAAGEQIFKETDDCGRRHRSAGTRP